MLRASRRALLTAIVAVPLLVICAATSFGAVTLKGKVINTSELLNLVWNEAKDPKNHRYNFREPAATVPPDVRVLRGHLSKELCIVAMAEGAQALKTPLRIVVGGGRTSPTTLVVPPGQELQFENRDPFPHNLYEVSGKGGLGEGQMAADATRNWTPPGPGKYEIRDKLTPSLRSWVIVDAKAKKAVYPNRKGDFTMELEPGNYEIRAFFNGEPVGEALPVEVKPGPTEQTLPNPLKAGADKKAPEKKDPSKAGG